MNRFVLLIFLSLYFVEIYTQEYSDNHNINIKYNKEAKYPDGDFQLVKDILSKMEYTKEAIEALVDDKIMVSFYVNTDSTVSDVSIIKGLNYGINEEFIRVLKQLKFNPAIVSGSAIKQNMIISIPIRVGPGSKRKKSD